MDTFYHLTQPNQDPNSPLLSLNDEMSHRYESAATVTYQSHAKKKLAKIFPNSSQSIPMNIFPSTTPNAHHSNNGVNALRDESLNKNIKNLSRKSNQYSIEGAQFSRQKEKLLQHQTATLTSHNSNINHSLQHAKENLFNATASQITHLQQQQHYQQQSQHPPYFPYQPIRPLLSEDIDIEEFQERDHNSISTKMTHLAPQDMFSIRNVEIRNKQSRIFDPLVSQSSSQLRIGIINNDPCEDFQNPFDKQFTQMSGLNQTMSLRPKNAQLFQSIGGPSSTKSRSSNSNNCSKLVFALNLSNRRIPDLSTLLEPVRQTIQILDLSSNGLSCIPSEVLALPQLVSFVANNNTLSELPLRLFSDLRLSTLSVSNNLISRLPEQISMWKMSLVNLDVSRNHIREIPEEIAGMVNLESLNIASNDFQVLPISVVSMIQKLKLFAIDWFKYCSPARNVSLSGIMHASFIQQLAFTKRKDAAFVTFAEFTDFFSGRNSNSTDERITIDKQFKGTNYYERLKTEGHDDFDQRMWHAHHRQQLDESSEQVNMSMTTITESVIPREMEGIILPSNRIHHKSNQARRHMKPSLEGSMRSFMDLQAETTSRFASRTLGDDVHFELPISFQIDAARKRLEISQLAEEVQPQQQQQEQSDGRVENQKYGYRDSISGRNLLHQAVLDDDMSVIRQLVVLNPSLANQVDKEGQTPLSLSIIEERYFAAKILIFNQADVNVGGGDLGSCLCLGVMKMQYFLIRDLIRFGADLKKTDSFGNTALHYAFHQFDLNPEEAAKVVQILLDNRANPNCENNEKLTPLCFAVKKGCVEAVQVALKYNEKKSKASEGFHLNKLCGIDKATVLHIASELNHTEIVAMLLKSKVDIFIRRADNKLPQDVCQKYLLAKKLLHLNQGRLVNQFLKSTQTSMMPTEARHWESMNPNINNLRDHSDEDNVPEYASDDSGNFDSIDSECEARKSHKMRGVTGQAALQESCLVILEDSEQSEEEIEDEYVNGDAPKWFYQYHSQIPYSPNNLQSIQKMNTIITKITKHTNPAAIPVSNNNSSSHSRRQNKSGSRKSSQTGLYGKQQLDKKRQTAEQTSQFFRNMNKCKQFVMNSNHLREFKTMILAKQLPLPDRLRCLLQMELSRFRLSQILLSISQDCIYELIYSSGDTEEYLKSNGNSLMSLVNSSNELNKVIESIISELIAAPSFENNTVLQQLIDSFGDQTIKMNDFIGDKLKETIRQQEELRVLQRQSVKGDAVECDTIDYGGQSNVLSEFLELQSMAIISRSDFMQNTLRTEKQIIEKIVSSHH